MVGFNQEKLWTKKLAAKYIPNYEVFGEEFEYAAAIIASAKFAEIQDAVGASVQRVLFEDISNEESLSMLKDDVGSILDM